MCGIWGLLKNENIPICYQKWFSSFNKISNRGPDNSTIFKLDCSLMGFHRLSINDTSSKGNQPFTYYDEEKNSMFYGCINGEIYNSAELARTYDIKCDSSSDCEIIMHLFPLLGGKKMVKKLIGEFAIAVLQVPMNRPNERTLFLARDHLGIRPLFYSFSKDMKWFNFSSELKGIIDIRSNNNCSVTDAIKVSEYGFVNGQAAQFPPGQCATIQLHKSNHSKFDDYVWSIRQSEYACMQIKPSLKYENVSYLRKSIRTCLERCVSQMILHSPDVEIGALLSGGLDSSLIVSILAKTMRDRGERPLRTFSIGMPGGTDKKYAQIVANHCQTRHTHIEIKRDDMLKMIPKVIKAIESYDVTTVRASLGQYAIGQWISKNTSVKVLFLGDGSDELTSGYLYFKNNSDPLLMHDENIRLLQNISSFDVLRSDRGLAAHGLEARVPYLHQEFVNLYLGINPVYRMPFQRTRSNSIEKHLLRSSFDVKNEDGSPMYLPDSILWRKKEAFSDGITSENESWYTFIMQHILDYHNNNVFNVAIYPHGFRRALDHSDSEIEQETFGPKKKYNTHPIELLNPTNSLDYEKVFYYAIFEYYYGSDIDRNIIPYYWMPQFCSNVTDPSARILKAYR